MRLPVQQPGNVHHGVDEEVAANKAEAVFITESVQKAADGSGEFLCRIVILDTGRRRNAFFQFVQGEFVVSVPLEGPVGMILFDGEVPGNAADIADQRVRMLRRHRVPDPEVGVVCAFFRILHISQNVHRRFPDGGSVFSIQFGNGLLRALQKQVNDSAVLQTCHFLSASPIYYGFRSRCLIGGHSSSKKSITFFGEIQTGSKNRGKTDAKTIHFPGSVH